MGTPRRHPSNTPHPPDPSNEEAPMTDTTCPKCGQNHTGCTGHISSGERKGQPCRKPCKPGRVCTAHGGRAPQVRAAQERRDQEAEARAVLRRGLADAYGEHVPDVDPGEAMLRAVSWKYAEVVALRAKVADLDDEQRVWGTTRTEVEGAGALRLDVVDGDVEVGSAPGTKAIQTAGANIWWQMLRTAEEQLVKFAAAARAAGCDERRVRLAEQQGDLVAGVLRAILDAMLAALLAAGMADTLRDVWVQQVQVIVPRELRRLAATGGQ